MAIRIRAWPLELVNGRPLDPEVTSHHAEDLRRQVAPGLFHRLDLEHFPVSTLPALALANRAYRQGARAGEQMSFAIRDALFEAGRDISDPVVLAALAEEFGIASAEEPDRSAVLDDWDKGSRRGVQGSPHFFCRGRESFCPSLTITKDPEDGLSVAMDSTGLTRFLEQCLDGAPTEGGGDVSSGDL